MTTFEEKVSSSSISSGIPNDTDGIFEDLEFQILDGKSIEYPTIKLHCKCYS